MEKLKVELDLNEWNFILEVLSLNDKPMISGTAINMLKPQLDAEFEKQSNDK